MGWLWLLLAVVLAAGVLAVLVAADRLSWRRALAWGGWLLGALAAVAALLARRAPPVKHAPDPEPSHRLADQVGAEVLEDREAAREERVTLEADPAAPVAGRLSGAVGATRRRRP